MIALLHKTMSGQQLSLCMSSASFKTESAPQSTAHDSAESKCSHIRACSSLLVAFLATLLLSGLFFMSLSTFSAQSAFALTTNKATAKSNQTEGNGVIGGKETRLTWEGTVEEEQVSQLTLQLPEGSDLQNATTKVTVLSGLTREKIEASASVQGTQVVISFATPVDAQKLIRVEISGMKFPADGGSYTVEGTYTTEQETQKLASSPQITIISNTPVQAIVNWLDAQPWVEAWNSNHFLGMFLKPQLIVSSVVMLFPGWLVCLAIVICAYPVAIVLGMGFALLKISKNPLLRALAVVYINLLRGTPFFLQIYILFFGLPMLNINLDTNLLGFIVVAINSSAYLSEIFRAGIQSIPQGQYEAASSLGMNRFQTMTFIIIPQTIRRVIPPLTSDFITSYKDTSLLSSVGVMELMMFAKNLTTSTGNMTPYMTAALFYLAITLPLIKVVGSIEKRMEQSETGKTVNAAANTTANTALTTPASTAASKTQALSKEEN